MSHWQACLFVRSYSHGEEDAADSELAAMIVISDKLRKNAAQTIRYFYEQGVDVKIISGDNPMAATAVAKLSGVKKCEPNA